MSKLAHSVPLVLLGMALQALLGSARVGVVAGQDSHGQTPSRPSKQPSIVDEPQPPPTIPRSKSKALPSVAQPFQFSPATSGQFVPTEEPVWKDKSQYLLVIPSDEIRKWAKQPGPLVIVRGDVLRAGKRGNQEVRITTHCACIVHTQGEIPSATFAYEHNLFQATADSDEEFLRQLNHFYRTLAK